MYVHAPSLHFVHEGFPYLPTQRPYYVRPPSHVGTAYRNGTLMLFGIIALGVIAIGSYVAYSHSKSEAREGRIAESSTLRVILYTTSTLAALCLGSWWFLAISIFIDEWTIADYERATMFARVSQFMSPRDIWLAAGQPSLR